MKWILILLFLCEPGSCLTREELLEHLEDKQETRNTFDARVPRLIRPIGYVNEEPIWPRVLEKVKSEAELFFDDDNFAYKVAPHRDAVALIRKMDKEENYNKVLNFLEKFT
nr:Protein C17F4.2 [Haemonchus contortus]